MVQQFKLRPGKQPTYNIDAESVDTHIGRQSPWFVRGGRDRHFALCPYCDNPLLLKALYNRTEDSPKPYGSHIGKPVEGFRFDPTSQENCPYISKATDGGQGKKLEIDALASQLIDMAVSEFDRIVLILRDDLGFRFSDAFARRMLENWFSSEAYLYIGAHLRNLPWMILYFGGSLNLFGQPIQTHGAFADAIQDNIPSAKFDSRKRLINDGDYFRVELQALNHKAEIVDDELVETLDVRIKDYSKTKLADSAPEVFRYSIEFQPNRFEGLVHTSQERAKRNQPLLSMADEVKQNTGLFNKGDQT